MFTIKATYRGQTRKASFTDLTAFPSHSDIVAQIHRLFPISQGFYLSRLLFSPDAQAPSRILISREVRSDYDYSKCVRPFKDRKWENAQLRFNICDETNPPMVVDDVLGMTGVQSSRATSVGRISLAPTAAAPMDVDSSSLNARRQPTYPQRTRPTPQHSISTMSIESCCSVSEGKAEIKAMLSNFEAGLNRVLANNFEVPLSTTPQASVAYVPENMLENKEVKSAPPPSWCSMCTRDITAPQNGQGAWYSCADCHVVVCKNCHERGKPGFCLSVMGPHHMKLMSGQDACLPIPYLPTPWTNISTNAPFVAAPTITPNIPEAAKSPSNPGVCQPVIHRGVMCDVCNSTIEGVRHKCLDCRDYDLCTPCITSGSAEAHNPFHEFFEIKEPGRVIVHNVYSGNGEREARRGSVRAEPQALPVAPATPRAHSATCNLCDSRIVGDRYKCLTCPDFDTCTSCFAITQEQHPNHSFVKMTKKEDYIRNRRTAPPMHYATCDGCKMTIYGARFKCMHPECPDYDLCQNCEALPIPVHPPIHPLLKMKSPDSVIPTVYRVGQREVISSERDSLAQPASPEPIPPPPFLFNDSRPQTPAQEERAKTPTPASQVPSIKPPVPPKPEMMYSSTWTPEIPRFLDSYYAAPTVDTPLTKPTSSNPFADIVMANPPFIPAPTTPKPLETVSWPKVPEHMPNPWPTTNPAERQELLQLIADFAGPATSNNVRNGISGTRSSQEQEKVDDMITERVPRMSEKSSVFERLSLGLHPPTEIPAPVKEALPVPPPMERETVPVTGRFAPSTSWGTFAEDVGHLMQDFRHDITKDFTTIRGQIFENRAPSVAESTLSKEALLTRPEEEVADDSSVSNGFSVRQSLASLINDLPTLVPTKVSSPAAEAPEPLSESRIPLSATFVEDVTVSDGQVFPPGAEFVKCWRLMNDSGRDWPESTELVFLAGESLSATDKPVAVEVGSVAAGKEVDVWTGELKAPDVPGRYVGYWRLRADGELFGNSLWIEINVAEAEQHNSDESLASSSIIMPAASSATQSRVASVTVATLSVQSRTSVASSTEDNLSDAGSDISLISMPSSPSDDEDDAMWYETRSHATSDLATQVADAGNAAQATGGRPGRAESTTSTSAVTAMDYVLLYDDNSSNEE